MNPKATIVAIVLRTYETGIVDLQLPDGQFLQTSTLNIKEIVTEEPPAPEPEVRITNPRRDQQLSSAEEEVVEEVPAPKSRKK